MIRLFLYRYKKLPWKGGVQVVMVGDFHVDFTANNSQRFQQF